jgi:hypothetical protein
MLALLFCYAHEMDVSIAVTVHFVGLGDSSVPQRKEAGSEKMEAFCGTDRVEHIFKTTEKRSQGVLFARFKAGD